MKLLTVVQQLYVAHKDISNSVCGGTAMREANGYLVAAIKKSCEPKRGAYVQVWRFKNLAILTTEVLG